MQTPPAQVLAHLKNASLGVAKVWGLGFGFGVWSLGFRVWGLWFRVVSGLGFKV